MVATISALGLVDCRFWFEFRKSVFRYIYIYFAAVGIGYKIRTWSMKYEYERLLSHTVRTRYVYREEEHVLVWYAKYLSTYATSLCTKKTFHRIFVTLRVAHLVELNQGLSSIRTFIRTIKGNDGRWRQPSILCRRPCCLQCSTSLSCAIAISY